MKEKHSSNPLKRFGTVLGRRRQSHHPYGRTSSPERKSSSNLASAFSGFGKGKSKDRDNLSPNAERPNSPLKRLSSLPRSSHRSESPSRLGLGLSNTDAPNGTSTESPAEASRSAGVNGTSTVQDTIPEVQEPMSIPTVAEPKPEVNMTCSSSRSVANDHAARKRCRGLFSPTICHRCHNRS